MVAPRVVAARPGPGLGGGRRGGGEATVDLWRRISARQPRVRRVVLVGIALGLLLVAGIIALFVVVLG